MRLINVNSLQVEEFFGDAIPEYIILSHTWGLDEVSLDDWGQPELARTREGFTKIIKTCEIAKFRFDVEYVWVDTNCIDKRSSAELSEAINSMFHWYRNAKVCLVYLADVGFNEGPERQPEDWEEAISQPDWSPGGRFLRVRQEFRASRWFTRGWTLQELLAPQHVVFLSKSWQYIATRAHLKKEISDITRIPESALSGFSGWGWTVAEMMSWASERSTTRLEDIAYCLLGIFDINMPLLYGEGEKAFRRLQEEIIKVSNDQSIFAWSLDKHQSIVRQDSLLPVVDLAPSPKNFHWITYDGPERVFYRKLMPFLERSHYMMTNSGLRITVPLVATSDKRTYLVPIHFARGVLRHAPRRYFLVMHTSNGVNFSRSAGFPVPIALKLRMKPVLEYRTVYFKRGISMQAFKGTVDPPLYQRVVIAVFWKYQTWDDVGFATLEPTKSGWQLQDKDSVQSATLELHHTDREGWYCRVFQLHLPASGIPFYVLVGSRPSNNGKKQLWKAYRLRGRPREGDTYISLFDQLRQKGAAGKEEVEGGGGPFVFLQYPYWGADSSLMKHHHPVVCIMHSEYMEQAYDYTEDDGSEEEEGE